MPRPSKTNPFPEGSAEWSDWEVERAQDRELAATAKPATHRNVRVLVAVATINQAKSLATLAGDGTDFRTVLGDGAERALAEYIKRVQGLLITPDNDMPF